MTEKTLLLVVDVQVGMFEGQSKPPYNGDQLLANIRGLIDRARDARVDVMYVRHTDDHYETTSVGHPNWEVHPAIAPEPVDFVFNKYACDSFYDTPLQEELTKRGIERIVIAGLQTELCIDTVSRSALHRDFNVTLASDGHSTWDTKNITAEQIIEHHNKTLYNVPHPTKEIKVVPSAEIVFVGDAVAVG